MLNFFRRDSAAGLVLCAATLLAVALSNSALAPWYQHVLGLELAVRFSAFGIAKSVLLWINDGLMAIFFFLVGLEIKREVLLGELSSPRRLALPLAAAIGGMTLPAAIYAAINWHDPIGIRGWAIPSATDIAFALGALSLLSSRIPASLRVFLTAVAILDDLGAIIIIAMFYTDDLSAAMLLGALMCLAALSLLNLLRVRMAAPYILLGLVLWVCVLKSGVHATLAGVATAFAIPLAPGARDSHVRALAPVDRLEHALKPWVNFGILPIFALANAGLPFTGVTSDAFLHTVTLGIIIGLIAGKSIGVFTGAWVAIRLRVAEAPAGADFKMLFGIACLCGIGFTMSLFIGSLAFGGSGDYGVFLKLGVISGSLVAGVLGSSILAISPCPRGSP
jgi:NhaA family Na+:H+ antiporter